MKKIMLAVALLAVLAGISYLQSIRQDQKRVETFRKGYSRAAVEIEGEQRRNDSLNNLLSRQKTTMADSLQMREQAYAAGLDSLSAIITDQNKQMASIPESNSPNADSKKSNGAVTAKKKEHNSDGHHKVLAWYKAAIDELPTDLTKYEERVAVQEVRSETATKFAITMARLDELRHDHKITY